MVLTELGYDQHRAERILAPPTEAPRLPRAEHCRDHQEQELHGARGVPDTGQRRTFRMKRGRHMQSLQGYDVEGMVFEKAMNGKGV